jgi:pyruvate/2-oxoglutarate/acetoin dehydrogenase E1 component
MSVTERLAETLAELLREDPRRVILGEDATDGGMLGLSRACIADERLAERVLATPLVPTSCVAHAAGLARAGRRPILVFASALGLVEGLAGLREAARLGWRTADESSTAGLLMIAPCGPGFGLGGDASDGIDALLTRVPGLRVLCVGRAHEASAWLRAAADVDEARGPTVLLVPRRLLVADGEASVNDLGRSPHEVARIRDGAEATVFAWGATVDVALAAVEQAQVDATVVDVGCLAPLDADGLVDAARHTGKIVIAHAGPAAGGIGGELAALFADRAILYLDAPVTRVAGEPGPFGPDDEGRAVPTVARVAEALTHVARY